MATRELGSGGRPLSDPTGLTEHLSNDTSQTTSVTRIAIHPARQRAWLLFRKALRMSLSYHEPISELSPQTREIHRALATLVEELEAVDWYQQRVDASDNEDLKGILAHNRDEEIEHAVMALEWLRRTMPKFDEELRTYLFTSEPIAQIEDAATSETEDNDVEPPESEGLGIGSLKQ